MAAGYREFLTRSPDGVQLYARDYAGPAGAVPVVCLPGLTRNSKDFEALAPWLATGRRVVCPDFRGRGRSGRAEPASYRPDQELSDTLQILDELGIGRVAIVGTSRGGIVALAMAARALGRIAGVCFNDIGPRIEPDGLVRIWGYLGAESQLAGWDDAVAALKRTTPGFESLTEAQWHVFARRVFTESHGKPHSDHDPGLAANFPPVEMIKAGKVPEMWGLFDLLSGVPCLVLRGEHSDLLSGETVAEMKRRHPGLLAETVANRGHVPFLDEAECLSALAEWLAKVDAAPA